MNISMRFSFVMNVLVFLERFIWFVNLIFMNTIWIKELFKQLMSDIIVALNQEQDRLD